MFAERTGSLIGAMLGKDYRVLEQIGAGGMAVVYLVEHQTLLKRFAAKVLSAELASNMEARARFTEEAHAASQLDHENIVSISDFGVTADQRPFFVMELLRGQTLDQRLGGGPVTIEEVVAVSVPVARALAHAHAEGIVHRDIKPENIFLVQRSQGRWGVKVVDFGIAKTPLNPRLTQVRLKRGETLGSPPFMAPEMIRGEEELVDPRTDVYSFGVLLYLMLCGRLPFDDEDLLKVMRMHLSLPVPPPREVNPALSPELAAVVERALAKRREDRYPSMDALLLDLEAALPPGSDRLLIEARSGTMLGGTPFASALSLARIDAHRARALSLPPPNVALPVADRRSRASIGLVVGVAALALIGAVGASGWRGMTGRSNASSEPEAPPPGVATPRAEIATASAPQATAVPRPPPAEVSAASVARVAPDESTPVPSEEPREPPRTVPRGAAPAPRAIQTLKATRFSTSTRPKLPVKNSTIITGIDPGSSMAGDLPDRAGSAADEPHMGSSDRSPRVPAPITAAPEAPTPVPAPPAPASAAPPTISPSAAAQTVPATSAPAAVPPPGHTGSLGRFDAIPEVASFEVSGSLSPSLVRRSVERSLPALRACYGAAARDGRGTPEVDLPLRFEIDENSAAIHVAVGNSGSLARCAAGVASQIRTPEAPDVGTVKVTAIIHFRPS